MDIFRIINEEVINLLEKRRNADKNRDLTFNEFYNRIVNFVNGDLSRVFVSFRDGVHVTDINPMNIYNTPTGFYTYPLISYHEYIKKHDNITQVEFRRLFPYASEKRYIFFFILRNMDGILTKDTDKSIIDGYVRRIRSLYSNDSNVVELCDRFLRGEYKSSYTNYVKHSTHLFWLFLYDIANVMIGGNNNNNNNNNNNRSKVTLFTIICNKIGINGFIDYYGEEFIHSSEPYQGVFFKVKNLGNFYYFDGRDISDTDDIDYDSSSFIRKIMDTDDNKIPQDIKFKGLLGFIRKKVDLSNKIFILNSDKRFLGYINRKFSYREQIWIIRYIIDYIGKFPFYMVSSLNNGDMNYELGIILRDIGIDKILSLKMNKKKFFSIIKNENEFKFILNLIYNGDEINGDDINIILELIYENNNIDSKVSNKIYEYYIKFLERITDGWEKLDKIDYPSSIFNSISIFYKVLRYVRDIDIILRFFENTKNIIPQIINLTDGSPDSLFLNIIKKIKIFDDDVNTILKILGTFIDNIDEEAIMSFLINYINFLFSSKDRGIIFNYMLSQIKDRDNINKIYEEIDEKIKMNDYSYKLKFIENIGYKKYDLSLSYLKNKFGGKYKNLYNIDILDEISKLSDSLIVMVNDDKEKHIKILNNLKELMNIK